MKKQGEDNVSFFTKNSLSGIQDHDFTKIMIKP